MDEGVPTSDGTASNPSAVPSWDTPKDYAVPPYPPDPSRNTEKRSCWIRRRGLVLGTVVLCVIVVGVAVVVLIKRPGSTPTSPPRGGAASMADKLGGSSAAADEDVVAERPGPSPTDDTRPSPSPTNPRPSRPPATARPTAAPTERPSRSPTGPPTPAPLTCGGEVFGCRTDRIGHEQPLRRGEAMCSRKDLYVLGMNEGGTLLWRDCTTGDTRVYYDGAAAGGGDAHSFVMEPDAKFVVRGEDGGVVWERGCEETVSPTGTCLRNPHFECPYLHLHKGGVCVLNFIDPVRGWVSKNINRIYNF